MIKYVLQRLVTLPLMLLAVSLVVFLAAHLAPGDPALMILGPNATPESLRALRATLGLDDPLHVQYGSFLWNALHGDFGSSYLTGLSVTSEVMRALPVSATLTAVAMIIGVSIGVAIGVVAAVRQYSVVDNVFRVLAIAGVSIPVFWLGLMLIFEFSVSLRLLPTSGWGRIDNLILPTVCLATFPVSALSRMTRACLLGELRKDYVIAARAKGLSEASVVVKHALKNALIPVVTLIGVQSGLMLGGAVLTETVFALPGLGRLLIKSIFGRDIPVIQGCVLTITAIFLAINLVVDILYSYIDPRISRM